MRCARGFPGSVTTSVASAFSFGVAFFDVGKTPTSSRKHGLTVRQSRGLPPEFIHAGRFGCRARAHFKERDVVSHLTAPRASAVSLYGLLGRVHRPIYPNRAPSGLLARDRAMLCTHWVVFRVLADMNRCLMGALVSKQHGRGVEVNASTLAGAMPK